MTSQNNDPNHFSQKVGAKQTRKIQARRDKEHNIWFGLGMIGTVGWSISIPVILGVMLGMWLDTKSHAGISWTLTLLFLGLVIGCLNAYYWVKKQLKNTSRRPDDK